MGPPFIVLHFVYLLLSSYNDITELSHWYKVNKVIYTPDFSSRQMRQKTQKLHTRCKCKCNDCYQ